MVRHFTLIHTMRNYLFIGFILFFFAGSHAQAQGYVFKILANKGENVMKSSDAGADWEPLRTGSSLNEGDIVKIVEGAYVGLIHSSGKTKEITTPGSYNVTDLAAALSSGDGGVAAKYADFVLTKMTETDEDINANYGHYVNATGAVERDVNASKLKLMMNKSTKVYGNEVVVRWAEGDPSETYMVTLLSIFDKTIKEMEVSESSLTLNFDDEMLQGQHFVKVTVQVMGNDSIVSEPYGIERLPPGRIQAISDEWTALQGEISEETPLNYLVKAGFFEEKGLLLDALTAYEHAIKLAPDVESFREMYQDFLVRTKLAGTDENN